MGLGNILCDFVLLNCSNEFRKQVIDKKYASINPVELTENLRQLLQKGDTHDTDNSAIASLIALSSMALLQYQKEATPADKENCKDFS